MTTSILLLAVSSYSEQQLQAAITDTQMVLAEMMGPEERETELDRLRALCREAERRKSRI